MKENIEEIAESIKFRRDGELSMNATNPAFARSAVRLRNKDTFFWLLNKEDNRGLLQREDITGSIIGANSGNRTTLSGYGQPIYKNSKIGEILILNHQGVHRYDAPGGTFDIEIFNRASFNPSDEYNVYATDIIIQLAEDEKTHVFPDIYTILQKRLDIEKDRERLSHAVDSEALELIKRIDEKEAEFKEYLDKSQGFIRKYAELRYQPILDPIQEKIKRSKIFDGALIINGGPGTGKTTSLIQRIKFLISNTIEEYITLTQEQKDILFKQETSWIFYSPNELLALFLRNSMKMEGLVADMERVKVWNAQKGELIKSYKLVDITTKRPFLFYNKAKDNNLFLRGPEGVGGVVSELEKFYFDYQKDKLKRVAAIDISTFKWKNTGISIQKYIDPKKGIVNIEELIRLFLNLNETYKAESDNIAEEYSSLVKKVAGRIQVEILKDTARTVALHDLLYTWKTERQDLEDDEDDDEEDIESEDFDEKNEQSTFDFERELFIKLRSLCRKHALRMFDKNTKFSKRDKELVKLIPEVESQDEYENIGQTAFFKKHFERIIKGISANVFREIPMIYKKFRRQQFVAQSSFWDLIILEDLVNKDKNSRIHVDEQALLLYFINNICYSLAKGYRNQFNTLKHPYINSYKEYCRPVIGIDEASDFSVIDLLAINSFKHYELSSVTLSGDLMQRMTKKGLNSWEDFSSIVPNTVKMDLEKSYRQSPTLLAFAQSIYLASTGEDAKYTSYIEKDENEPKPLILVSEDNEEKLEWIADRIIEIYRAHGDTIPSIAIFLPEESQLEGFANDLGSIDTLSDVGILVKACRGGEVLGEINTVRVFSIDKIKGLEFEAVFFHNIDEFQRKNLSNDLLLKYLYVGLSRATFYLALTVNEELNDDLKFIFNNFDQSGMTWG